MWAEIFRFELAVADSLTAVLIHTNGRTIPKRKFVETSQSEWLESAEKAKIMAQVSAFVLLTSWQKSFFAVLCFTRMCGRQATAKSPNL